MEVFEGEPAVEKKPTRESSPGGAKSRPRRGDGAGGGPATAGVRPRSGRAPLRPEMIAGSAEKVPQTSLANTAYETDRPPVPPGANTSDTLIGQRIDHFEIRAQLGQGGMGTVYLAHDLSLERPVAIKVLRRELASSPDLVGRLVLEARAQARLQHPNVVNVYYIGQFEGAPYLAMEYVRGQTLADRLRERGPAALGRGARIHHPDHPGPAGGQAPGHRPPRRQAVQPAAGPRWAPGTRPPPTSRSPTSAWPPPPR